MSQPFQLYYITDSAQLKPHMVEATIERAIDAAIDWVQIREKSLSARRLIGLTEHAVEVARRQPHTRVIVNDRLDVALAAEADGVHLGVRSMPAAVARMLAPPGFIVGASCHSLEEALAAEASGADYILLGPIFATPSKLLYGPPLGIAKLREATLQVSIPVFALGGITVERVALCRQNGAAGVAAIRLFQDADPVEELIRILRKTAGG